MSEPHEGGADPKEVARLRGEACFNTGGVLADNPFTVGQYGLWKAWRGGWKARRQAQRLIDAAKPIER